MSIFFAPSGEMIYSQDTAKEYLEKQGFSPDEISDFANFIQTTEYGDLLAEFEDEKAFADECELSADAYLNALNDVFRMVEDIKEEMECAPKNKSKAFFAKKLGNILVEIENYI